MKNLFKLVILFFVIFSSCASEAPRRAEVLFIGAANEKASNQATWLAVELFSSGVNLTYSDSLTSLKLDNLTKYDALILLTAEQHLNEEYEKSIRKFLKSGRGVVALNSSANAFKNSQWYTGLVNGGFENLGNGKALINVNNTSKVLDSTLSSFSVDNEIFAFNNKGETSKVLLTASINGKQEPYAWINEDNGGRFFFSALGSNDEVWKMSNFLKTVHSGIWWALGDKVKKQVAELNIPNVSIYPDSISDFTIRYDVNKVQDPLDANEAMKLIQKPVDFELKLFVSEPNIVNPIAMNWDEKGRLWVIESVDYPNSFEEVKGQGRDKIKICEDTDGDGVADKFTVFADGLNIATSLTFANDGVIVAMAPDFVFMKDTDGDGKMDYQKVIMTGWSKGDTHAGPSNLQYGFDNKIWGVTGYAGYNGIVDGKRQMFSQGLYSVNPDGSNFEYLATTSNNTWGLGMSEDNNVFISTANNTHSAFYSIPERFLQRKVKRTDNSSSVNAIQKIDGHYEVHALTPNLRQVDVVGGFTSAAGHQMYTARDFPKNYWNSMAFVTEPTVRLVHNAIIEKDGAGFKERDGWNLLASSDEWFGPIHAEVGPDGAVWVLDWYNFIIQHNVFVPAQAPSEKVVPLSFKDQIHGVGNAFESNLRDKKHGRVYRVLYKDGKHNESFKLSKDNPNELVRALKSKNKFWRTHAQRLLVERKSSDVQNDLIALVKDKTVDEIGLNTAAIHAIWTLKGLGLIEIKEVNEVILSALNHPSGGVRKAAIQVLDLNKENWAAVEKSSVFTDENLNTRLAAFVKIAESVPTPEIANVLVKAVDNKENQTDRWLNAALFAAIQTNQSDFVSKAQVLTGNEFVQGVLQALDDETYTLGRVSRMQFSPNVLDKNIVIETEVMRRDREGFNGMIIGQGDAINGYALYMKENKLFWDVYQNGTKNSISTTQGVGDKFQIQALLNQNGGMKLLVNKKLVGEVAGVKLFEVPLSTYLRSGHDLSEAPLTHFNRNSEFIGNVSEIKLRLGANHVDHHDHHHHGEAHSEEVNFEKAESPSEVIVIKAMKDIMQYDKRAITVKAGQQITLIMENPDAMPHNLVIIKPGTNEIVGKAADKMLQSSSAAQKHYVPEVPEVLFYTKLVNPGESYTLKFQAPKEKGDYPFICTFPGHWRGMNGVMRVVD